MLREPFKGLGSQHHQARQVLGHQHIYCTAHSAATNRPKSMDAPCFRWRAAEEAGTSVVHVRHEPGCSSQRMARRHVEAARSDVAEA